MSRTFAATWDYRCPFARNVHTAITRALREGADWEVEFRAFSLDQVHVEEGGTPVWERPAHERGSGVLALEWGIAVRDSFSERFLEFHDAVFAARFDEGRKIGKVEVLADVATAVGLDADVVAAEVAGGTPLKRLADEHTRSVEESAVFGVPTLIVGDEAVFVRLMEREHVADLEAALDLVEWTRLNEFKRTTVPR